MNFLINNKYTPKRLQEKIYSYLIWLVKLRSSSRAIALGVAIGVFVAVTPTVGLQIFLAVFLSSIFNANRPAAVIFVWTTNPFTFPFVYGFTYWVGNLFWSGPPLFHVERILMKTDYALDKGEVWHFYDRLKTILTLWKDIFIPLTIGGIIVGVVAGGIAYLITLRVILYCKKHLRHTHHENT